MSTTAFPETGSRTVGPRAPPRERFASYRDVPWMMGIWRHLRWPLYVCTCLFIVFALVVAWIWQITPSTANLHDWVLMRDAQYHATYTPLAAVSPWLARALVATEDERFYSHHGIDTIGLVRAAWDDLRASRMVEGGSTLTAQLAKNAYLNDYDHTIPLKVKDLVLAVKIENHYSKDQIMEMYLNLVYFGEGAYGIGAAASRYFGTTPAHLDLAQAALLAGLVQAPGAYDPWCDPTLAHQRQVEVLNQMVAAAYISPAQARTAAHEAFAFWQPNATRPADTYCAA